jgi:hypothetical protein
MEIMEKDVEDSSKEASSSLFLTDQGMFLLPLLVSSPSLDIIEKRDIINECIEKFKMAWKEKM